MSDQKNISEENDPVRKKLQNLPKSKAPWYFEARLQQRIRGESRPQGNWFTARPLPALALSAGVFLFVCVAGYYTLIVPPGNDQQIILPDSSGSPNSIPQTIPEPEKTSPYPVQNAEPPAGKAGPNAPSTDVTVESGVHIESDQPATTGNSSQSRQNSGGETVSGLKLKGGTPNRVNLVHFDSLTKKVSDSIKSKRDTITIAK